MKLVVGLGNPGSRYQNNRHNLGFMAVDAIVRRHNFSRVGEKFSGELFEGKIGTEKTFAFKPMTFMNRSGIPTAELANFYKIPTLATFVIHDELDLNLGRIRVKQAGGNGGHNGLKSLDAHYGQDYYRVRAGIDHPGAKSMVNSHVLSDFSKDEMPVANALVDAIALHIEQLIKGDISGFQNKMALAMQPFLPEKKGEAKEAKETKEVKGSDDGV